VGCVCLEDKLEKRVKLGGVATLWQVLTVIVACLQGGGGIKLSEPDVKRGGLRQRATMKVGGHMTQFAAWREERNFYDHSTGGLREKGT